MSFGTRIALHTLSEDEVTPSLDYTETRPRGAGEKEEESIRGNKAVVQR